MAAVGLYEKINELVLERVSKAVESDERVNLPDWVSEIMESAADMILWGAPEEERRRLVEHGREELSRFVREKKDLVEAQLRQPS